MDVSSERSASRKESILVCRGHRFRAIQGGFHFLHQSTIFVEWEWWDASTLHEEKVRPESWKGERG